MYRNTLSVLHSNYDILVLGDSQAGKTSLILRYIRREYISDSAPSAEELYTKAVTDISGKYCENTILDSSSLIDQYSSSRKQQIFNANVVIFIYSIDDITSFEAVQDSIDFTKSLRPDVQFYLLGTKLDLDDMRHVSYAQGYELAKSLGALGFWECSAKTGSHVAEIFDSITQHLINLKSQPPDISKEPVLEPLQTRQANSIYTKSLRSQQSKKIEHHSQSGCCTIV